MPKTEAELEDNAARRDRFWGSFPENSNKTGVLRMTPNSETLAMYFVESF
jgi:hypothetical protein